jgi:hypothetical protein
LILSLLAVLTAVLLIVFVIRLSRSPQAKVQLGTDTFPVGPANRLAAQVAKAGPVLFPSLRGPGLELLVQHLGADSIHGWLAFQALRPDRCVLRWRPAQRDLVDPCNQDTFPADGTGLEHYRVTVDVTGTLTVDLRQPTGPVPSPT